MTRIIWMQDFNPFMGGGGGLEGGSQLTDRRHIVEGLKRGHEIFILTPENQNILTIHPSDFIIISNIAKFDPERVNKLPNRYAVFHHDFWFRCKWRLYFPVSEKCLVDCPQAPVWEPILRKAVLHIFLSPLHYVMNREKFGESVEPHIMVPSPVNPDEFFDHMRPDRQGTCNLNGLLMFKGRTTILEYAKTHPEEKITFAGANDKPQEALPPNCEYIREIPDGGVPDFYSRYETYLELPNTPQPFNRSVAEAYLSGCKVRGNELVGALSWPWFTDRKTVAEKLKEAPRDFWLGVEAVL